MSEEVFIRGLSSGIMALTIAWVVFSRQDEERTGVSEFDGQRYRPYISGALLPTCLLALFVAAAVILGFGKAARMMLSACFGIFLSICLYYPVLLLTIPVLRRHISARTCAMLWLLPNYLYILSYSSMELPSPLFVIPLKGTLIRVLAGVWFAGFMTVLLHKCIEHSRFRQRLLADARPVTDPEVTGLWNAMLEEAGFRKPKFKLVTSPAAATALTIGLFKRTTRVVLPDRAYSGEELELILRHELIHIGREDAWSKFFMIFCTAMCWFNPLMWIAMRKSADDMELSCDETVLLNADEDTRKKYAHLLLDTAGDERGFTPCLSASANAMRYRLRSAAKPGKRHSGALIVGAALFLLIMSSGYVALAYNGVSGGKALYQSEDLSVCSIRNFDTSSDAFNTNYEILDEAAFQKYLAGLTVYELSGNYSYSDRERSASFYMDSPGGRNLIELYDHSVRVVRLGGARPKEESYYIPDGLDWGFIDSIIVPQPACNVALYKQGDACGRDLYGYVSSLWKTTDSERVLVRKGSDPEGESHGIYGYEPDTAVFSFSHELAAPFSVLVESWDRSESRTVSQSEMTYGFTMSLPDHPAHYTVSAAFLAPDGSLYEAEFRFSLGETGSE